MEALGINVPGLLTQLVSLLVLFAILYALLYKPLLRAIDQRSSRIREGLEAAEKMRQEAARSQEEMEGQIAATRAEGQSMIARAKEVADQFRAEELAKAREEIAAEWAKAQANIQRERDAAIEELRREFAGLAIQAAERLVERSLDGPAHRELIDKALEEAPKISNGQGKQQLRLEPPRSGGSDTDLSGPS